MCEHFLHFRKLEGRTTRLPGYDPRHQGDFNAAVETAREKRMGKSEEDKPRAEPKAPPTEVSPVPPKLPPVPPAPPSEDEAVAEPAGGTDEEGTNDDLTDDDAMEQEPAPSTGRRRSYKEASDVPRVKTVKVIVEPAARAPPRSQPRRRRPCRQPRLRCQPRPRRLPRTRGWATPSSPPRK